MQYYGRHQQDRLALELINRSGPGTYMDVGATDGITSNNTYALEQMGWKGVCVEPNYPYYQKLVQNRKCPCINACMGSRAQTGLVRFHENPGNGELSAISNGGGLWRPCLDFNSIAGALGLCEVDFLSIDTEGNELDIIRDIDFDAFRIKVICYEHNQQNGELFRQRKQQVEAILAPRYRKAMDIDTDSIFILQEG